MVLAAITPQHNPIEIQWREIKRALAGRYYKDGFPEIQKSILHMMENGEVGTVRLLANSTYKHILTALMENGEVGTVRLLEYMRNAIQDAKNNALISELRAA